MSQDITKASQPKPNATRTVAELLALNQRLQPDSIEKKRPSIARIERWRASIREAEHSINILIKVLKEKSEVVNELLAKREELKRSKHSEDKKDVNIISVVFEDLQEWLDKMTKTFQDALEHRKQEAEDKKGRLGPLAFLLQEYKEEISKEKASTSGDSKKFDSNSENIKRAISAWNEKKEKKSRSKEAKKAELTKNEPNPPGNEVKKVHFANTITTTSEDKKGEDKEDKHEQEPSKRARGHSHSRTHSHSQLAITITTKERKK